MYRVLMQRRGDRLVPIAIRYETAAELLAELKKYMGQVDVYISIAEFDRPERKAQYAVAVDRIVADIDVAHNSHYETKEAALAAIYEITQSVPPSLIVDSGGGFHLYWLLEEKISPQVWTPLARALRHRLSKLGLRADWSITTDLARVLRLPGTVNSRTGTLCRPIRQGQKYTVAQLRTALELRDEKPDEEDGDEDDIGQRAGVTAPLTVDLQQLVERCAVVRWHYETRGREASEPQWQDMVLLSLWTADPEQTARLLSSGHPEYTEAQLRQKLEIKKRYRDEGVGPPTCEHLAETHPGRCEGCPWRGRARTPLHATLLDRDTFTFDELCRPAYFVRDGATYVQTDDGSKLLFPGWLDGLQRSVEYREGELEFIIRGRYCRLNDRAGRPFAISVSELAGAVGVVKATARAIGVTVSETRSLIGMWSLLTRQLATAQRERDVFFRLGVHETSRGEVFVIGDRLIDSEGKAHPAQLQAPHLLQAFSRRGSQEKALELFRAWFDAEPRPEARAFVLASLAAPLYHLIASDAPIVALTHPHSGSGKTSTLRVAEAIWINPEAGSRLTNPTPKAVVEILATRRQLPVFWDEIRLDAQAADTIFMAAQGQGRLRLKRSGTLAKVDAFRTFILGTSNSPVRAMLRRASLDAETAAVARVLDLPLGRFEVMPLPPSHYDRLLREFEANCGQIGLWWLQHMWPTEQRRKFAERAQLWIQRLQDRLPPGAVQTARIGVRVVASVVTVAEELEQLFGMAGLVQPVGRAMAQSLQQMVEEARSTLAEADARLMEYLRAAGRTTVYLRGTAVLRPPEVTPVQVDVDVETGEVRISMTALDRWLAERHGTVEALRQAMPAEAVRIDAACPLGGPADPSATLVPALVVRCDALPEGNRLRLYMERLRAVYSTNRPTLRAVT